MGKQFFVADDDDFDITTPGKPVLEGLVRHGTVVDYVTLLGKLPNPKVVPSDIDGLLERNWYFLLFECKHKDDPECSVGQNILLDHAADFPRFTVIDFILSGQRTKANSLVFDPIEYRVRKYNGVFRQCTLDDVVQLITLWWEWADKQPRPALTKKNPFFTALQDSDFIEVPF